ncbi:solute carrier family 35 member F2-like isoform X1 [Panicum virgatum]|uniref:solute carrier family 35 member F2-like isoform X1 n=1 Tax=Panicum virgatum TaxID=38727 RepID=UPI0019D527E9|nr:solute carrier family 35 member F2-like isoform X1 [Panicum virgatum]
MEVKRDTWRLLFSLFLGQIVSFSMAISSFTTSVISSLGVDAPLAQSFLVYMLLALVYGTILLHRRQKLLIPWYWYLTLVFIDVPGNFLAIRAYQYSYITSINLLDCWTIPWVMILTRFALGTRYSFWQFVGAGTCMAGLSLVLLSDSNSPDVQDASKRPLLGDVLIIAATFCFAFSNVGEEYCVKKKDRIEFIAMLGIFGVLVTGIQIINHRSLFERKNLETINWSPKMISLFTGFAIAAFVFSTISSFVLKMSGSTMFNLSLLTTDIWAVAIRYFFYHQQVNWLYYLAFAVVAMGLIIYLRNESSSDDETAPSTTETTQYEQLSSEESGGANLDWQNRKHQEDDHTC